jgi:peptide/nickel transport system permease protein
MRQYAARRILFFVPVVIAASMITFFGLNLIPGEPALNFMPIDTPQEEIDAWRETRGLNDAIMPRYVRWLGGMLVGDPGPALVSGTSINAEIKERWPVSMLILTFSFGFGTFFGILFGTIAAVFQDSPFDYFVRTFSIFGMSIPDFYALTLLMIIPAILWRYAPPFGYMPFWEDPWRAARQIIPPTLILSIGGAGLLMRLVRSSLLEVLRQDYITTARAKGLREQTVLFRHAFKNASIPILTVLGGVIAGLLGGSVILENITSLPGLGQYMFTGVVMGDYNVVMAMTTYSAILLITSHLVVDLLYAWADPRIRY